MRDPLARADRRVLDAILAQHRVGEREDSTGSLDRFYRRLQGRLDHEHGPGTVQIPSAKAVARYVEVLFAGPVHLRQDDQGVAGGAREDHGLPAGHIQSEEVGDGLAGEVAGKELYDVERVESPTAMSDVGAFLADVARLVRAATALNPYPTEESA